MPRYIETEVEKLRRLLKEAYGYLPENVGMRTSMRTSKLDILRRRIEIACGIKKMEIHENSKTNE